MRVSKKRTRNRTEKYAAIAAHNAPTKAWALNRVAQVALAGVREHVRVRAPSAEGVPRSPQDVSAEWLTAALCADAPGVRVLSVAAGPASVGTTTRAGLAVTYNEAGAAAGLPTRLFVKCTTTVAQLLERQDFSERRDRTAQLVVGQVGRRADPQHIPTEIGQHSVRAEA